MLKISSITVIVLKVINCSLNNNGSLNDLTVDTKNNNYDGKLDSKKYKFIKHNGKYLSNVKGKTIRLVDKLEDSTLYSLEKLENGNYLIGLKNSNRVVKYPYLAFFPVSTTSKKNSNDWKQQITIEKINDSGDKDKDSKTTSDGISKQQNVGKRLMIKNYTLYSKNSKLYGLRTEKKDKLELANPKKFSFEFLDPLIAHLSPLGNEFKKRILSPFYLTQDGKFISTDNNQNALLSGLTSSDDESDLPSDASYTDGVNTNNVHKVKVSTVSTVSNPGYFNIKSEDGKYLSHLKDSLTAKFKDLNQEDFQLFAFKPIGKNATNIINTESGLCLTRKVIQNGKKDDEGCSIHLIFDDCTSSDEQMFSIKTKVYEEEGFYLSSLFTFNYLSLDNYHQNTLTMSATPSSKTLRLNLIKNDDGKTFEIMDSKTKQYFRFDGLESIILSNIPSNFKIVFDENSDMVVIKYSDDKCLTQPRTTSFNNFSNVGMSEPDKLLRIKISDCDGTIEQNFKKVKQIELHRSNPEKRLLIPAQQFHNMDLFNENPMNKDSPKNIEDSPKNIEDSSKDSENSEDSDSNDSLNAHCVDQETSTKIIKDNKNLLGVITNLKKEISGLKNNEKYGKNGENISDLPPRNRKTYNNKDSPFISELDYAFPNKNNNIVEAIPIDQV